MFEGDTFTLKKSFPWTFNVKSVEIWNGCTYIGSLVIGGKLASNSLGPHHKLLIQARGEFCQRVYSREKNKNQSWRAECHGEGEIVDYLKGMWS